MIKDQLGLPHGLNRYKGNLHSHTTNSDGRLAPAAAVADYRAHGYQFLCLTEHDLFTDLSGEFDGEDFVILPGIEASAYLYDDENHRARLRCHHLCGGASRALWRLGRPCGGAAGCRRARGARLRRGLQPSHLEPG